MAAAAKTLDWLLKRSSVRMRNVPLVKSKLETMISGGKNRFQVVTDFDYTLSRAYNPSGSQCSTIHGLFDRETGHFDNSISKKLHKLTEKYAPIEFSPDLTNEEKTPHMLTWWKTMHDLIVKCGLNYCKLEEIMKLAHSDNLMMLRDDTRRFLQLTESKDVPLVIFSAGIGDLIEIHLRQQLGSLPANVHIISNMITYDAEGNVVGFKEPLIHTFNKNSTVVNGEEEFFHRLAGRDHVLLLGDSIGDLNMSASTDRRHEEVVLKLGFLNFNVNGLMNGYLDGFDVVLVKDQTMTIPVELVSRITES